jgi:peptidyl-prolyl cis-trans isomerase SurA
MATFSPRMIRLMVIMLLAIQADASAQTLFSYGNHAVSKAEFLKAYNKNNTDSSIPRISYNNYLDLYSKFRMKVQAALDEKMDTTQQQRSEVQAFRNQLSETYMKEDASIKLLVEEAARRSLKDIRLTDIYVPLKPGPTADEISAAEAKISTAYERLKKGEPFDKVAAEYNYADFGFITTFVVPYEIENIAYTTPLGKYSSPYQNAKGFHIFRPTEERKALGKIRAAQILLAFPPGADDNMRKHIAQRADSAYDALKNGKEFSALATIISNDNLSYQGGGILPVFGIGQYDSLFETTAFALVKDGDISKPFESSFGYHILTRIERIPIVEDLNNKEWNTVIRERVEQSDRMKVAQQMLLQNIRRTIKKDAPGETQTSDTAALLYYREHLEKYNPEFADQLKEFKDGNLLFTIMQKKVWDAASGDSIALEKYYNDNKNKYWWENSADALIITCQNKTQIEEARNTLGSNFSGWRKFVESTAFVQADSGRYELGQIPVVERTNFTEGLMTAPFTNAQDSSLTFACIIKLYMAREPKKFEEAKGAVINDYQASLENTWIDALKQKYPLKINQKVFRKLP